MIDINLWLGTESSLVQLLKAVRYSMQNPAQAAGVLEVVDSEEGDEYSSYLLQREDSVGILNISGPLVDSDEWYNRIFGLVSYPEIARALQELVADDSVTSILLNIDSGGGTVAGLEEASEAVKWARGFKPVEAHTSGSMMSAAYWIGASANTITASKMSDLGSIGVLLVHRSVYQALKDDGIEYTVVRAGKYKALGHPAEQLSDEAKEIMQGKADTLYGYFLNHVSSERPALSLVNKGSWAEGLTFFGEEAVQLGMADRLSSLSDRVEGLDYVDKRRQETNNSVITSEASDMKKSKKVILRSEADKAALENGANLEDLADADAEVEIEPTAEVEDSGANDDPVAENPTADADPDAPSDLSVYLKDQNSSLTEEVSGLKAKVATLEADKAESKASLEGLRAIAETHIHRMQIPLNSAPIDLAELPASTVIAQHGKVLEQFDTKFKVGQQSRPVESDRDDDRAPFARLGIVPKS